MLGDEHSLIFFFWFSICFDLGYLVRMKYDTCETVRGSANTCRMDRAKVGDGHIPTIYAYIHMHPRAGSHIQEVADRTN